MRVRSFWISAPWVIVLLPWTTLKPLSSPGLWLAW